MDPTILDDVSGVLFLGSIWFPSYFWRSVLVEAKARDDNEWLALHGVGVDSEKYSRLIGGLDLMSAIRRAGERREVGARAPDRLW